MLPSSIRNILHLKYVNFLQNQSTRLENDVKFNGLEQNLQNF